jgi:hypothetical protein
MEEQSSFCRNDGGEAFIQAAAGVSILGPVAWVSLARAGEGSGVLLYQAWLLGAHMARARMLVAGFRGPGSQGG